MIRYALACVLMMGLGLTADAQVHNPHQHQHRQHQNRQQFQQHRHHHHGPVVQHNLRHTHRHYGFRYYHTPRVVVYGQLAQYQQYGFAVVGYSDLAAVQGICTQYGFQIVRVNPVQQFVVVRLPVGYSWNTIVNFSRVNHIRFVEPARRHYR